MTVHSLHPMTPAQAKSFLASLGYRSDMTFAECRAIADRLSHADCESFELALTVTAIACQAEAEALRREIARRNGESA